MLSVAPFRNFKHVESVTTPTWMAQQWHVSQLLITWDPNNLQTKLTSNTTVHCDRTMLIFSTWCMISVHQASRSNVYNTSRRTHLRARIKYLSCCIKKSSTIISNQLTIVTSQSLTAGKQKPPPWYMAKHALSDNLHRVLCVVTPLWIRGDGCWRLLPLSSSHAN